jgi:anti-anti-sigma factor
MSVAPPSLDVRVLDLGDMTVVGLDGDLVAETAGQLTAEVDRALARASSTIVLDLSLLERIDRDVSPALVDAARMVQAHDARLVMRHPSSSTRAVLDLTGASGVLEFTD